jgi:RecA-family ATPase
LIFNTLVKLAAGSDAFDMIALKEELGKSGELAAVGGPLYIASLVDGVPRSTNVESYARIVKEKATLRKLILSANKIVVAAYEQSEDARTIAEIGQHDLSSVVDAAGWLAATPAYSDDLATFLGAAPSAPAPLIDGLLPGEGLVLAHGQPRSRKSYVVLDALLSLAAGVSPFGTERLAVAAPTPCWYLTEEDPPARVKQRISALLAGRQAGPPELFRLSVWKGVTLTDGHCQDRIIREVREHGIRAIAFDPARAFSDAVDKGPGELTPLTRFLRRLMRETAVVPILVHHDTKPRNDGKPDGRARAQRASGGGLFSIADAPIHVERVDEESSLLVPNLWKF